MSIICPHCGYERNPPGAKVCEVCDLSLISSMDTPQAIAPSAPSGYASPKSKGSAPFLDKSYPDPPATIDLEPLEPRPLYPDPPATIDMQQEQPQPVYPDSPSQIEMNPRMNITCPQCGYESNPSGTEFCDVCGYELSSQSVNTPQPTAPSKIEENSPELHQSYPDPSPSVEIQQLESQPNYPSSTSTEGSTPSPIATAKTAKLISKQASSPLSEFLLEDSNLVGRFDPDSGPVEIDLEGFVGEDYVSRNHAEIYREGEQWKIKDLGSENGVFVKRSGQTRFSARITTPETLNSGDEVAFGKVRFVFQAS